jgi:hypothetical protein
MLAKYFRIVMPQPKKPSLECSFRSTKCVYLTSRKTGIIYKLKLTGMSEQFASVIEMIIAPLEGIPRVECYNLILVVLSDILNDPDVNYELLHMMDEFIEDYEKKINIVIRAIAYKIDEIMR